MTILSRNTIDILKNFSIINPMMILDWPSQIISVANRARTAMASAPVPEKWNEMWEIADVPQLLMLMDLHQDPASYAEVRGRSLFLISPDTETEYKLTHPPLILDSTGGKAVPKEIPINNPIATANIDKATWDKFTKASRTLRSTHIKLQAKDNKMVITAYDANKRANGTTKITIPATTNGVGEISVPIENLTMMSTDYAATLTEQFIHFKNDSNIQYWIVKQRTE